MAFLWKKNGADPAEYLNLRPHPTRVMSNTSALSAESLYKRDRTKLKKMVKDDPDLAANLHDHIEQYWWADLCKTANTEEFHEDLFEEELFDKDGMLDIHHPGFAKLVQLLAIGWMHIMEGSDSMRKELVHEYKVSWHRLKAHANEPFLVFEHRAMKHCFGLIPPPGGYYDHGSELKVLRQKREAVEKATGAAEIKAAVEDLNKHIGSYPTRSQNKAVAYEAEVAHSMTTSTLSTDTKSIEASVIVSSDDMEDTTNTKEPTSSMISGVDSTSQTGEDLDVSESDDDIFVEARRHVPAEEGYVYKRSDSKPARRRSWFLLW